MDNYLCLIRQDEQVDWFLLCVKETMFCIACGSLDSVLNSLRRLKKEYHNVWGLSEALHSMSEKPLPNKMTYGVYKSLYDSQHGQYDHYVEEILSDEREKERERKKPKKPLLAKKHKEVRTATEVKIETRLKTRPSAMMKKARKSLKGKLPV